MAEAADDLVPTDRSRGFLWGHRYLPRCVAQERYRATLYWLIAELRRVHGAGCPTSIHAFASLVGERCPALPPRGGAPDVCCSWRRVLAGSVLTATGGPLSMVTAH